MAKIGKPVCLVPSGDKTGEGLVWHAAENALYWCDINRFLIHRLDASNNSVRSWFFDEPVTTLGLTDRDDTLIAALSSRVILWKPETDSRQDTAFRLQSYPKTRTNDGRPDPRGSFWIGTMTNNVGPDGSDADESGKNGVLYRLDPDGSITEWRKDIGIANTATWSPDGKHFYSADTTENSVRVYDYDLNTGDISNEQPYFVDFPRGHPDGSVMDAEGYLWNCRYGGHCIVRVAPDGKVDQIIEMPVKNITNCTFGGPNLTTLYVTTAYGKMNPFERLGGSLFTIETDIKGQPENRFKTSGLK
jgi:sugar lactone lactonase YvrE